jgi:hypothetical protein
VEDWAEPLLRLGVVAARDSDRDWRMRVAFLLLHDCLLHSSAVAGVAGWMREVVDEAVDGQVVDTAYAMHRVCTDLDDVLDAEGRPEMSSMSCGSGSFDLDTDPALGPSGLLHPATDCRLVDETW